MMHIFREEHFGGLHYDPEECHLTYLDSENAKKFLDKKTNGIIIHRRPGSGYLSAPLKVFISMTSRCNLSCRHCVIHDPNNVIRETKAESIKCILEQLGNIGVLEVRLSGGEPTCRNDFFQMVEYAKKNHLTVSTNSNGVYSEEIKNKVAASGIDKIHISLDGLEEQNDFIRGKGAFKKSISSIKFLKERGKYIRIVVCLFKGNLPDIEGLIKLAEDMDCDIKFSPIAAVGKATSMAGLLDVDESKKVKDYIENYNSWVNVFYNLGTMIPEFNDYCQIDDFDGTVCGSGRTQLRVELSGDIYGAGCGDVDTSKEPLGTIGDEIENIWEKAQKTMLSEMHKKGGNCLDCNFPQIMTAWLNHASPSFNFKRKK